MRAGERRSDVESELALDDPMDLDDMVFSDEEESGGVVATSEERRDTTTSSVGDELVVAHRAADPSSRKRAASADVVGERTSKRTRSPHPLTMSPAPSPPMVDMAEQGGRSIEEGTGARSSPAMAMERDS